MRKLYPPLLAVIICTLFFTSIDAQRKLYRIQRAIAKPSIDAGTAGVAADCDSVDLATAFDSNWTATTYVYDNDNVYDTGFVNGTNIGLDKQKANFFDLSATSYAYLTRAFFLFGQANSSVIGNMSKDVFFRVYEDSSGQPGPLLATEQRTLTEIKDDVDSNSFTIIDFASPIALPASKKIYLSVDISNFTYPQDTIWVAGTEVGQDIPGKAWEQWSDDTWHSYSDNYGVDITLWIFPAVSVSSSGCGLLPVKLISFNAQRNNKDVALSWQIADEFGMKGYEVERSDNNGSFRTVATVPALNDAKNQSYSATDKNAFTISSTVQYRLKQMDGDGTVNYSRVISVKSASSISDISFANPFNGALKMQLNLATAQPVTAYLYDMQGKLVASEKTKMYNAASNTIIMASTANLQRGMYVLKVIAGTDQAVYKVVKQ